MRGLLKEGASSRVAYLKSLAESLGGKLEACYWAFGETDAYITVDGTDNLGAAALSLAVSAGAARVKTVVLLAPEEIEAAAKQGVSFRPPRVGTTA